MSQMLTSKIEAGEENSLVMTKLFQNVNESNYLEFVKIANIQFNYLNHSILSHGYDFVNWRVNFIELFEYLNEFAKMEMEALDFIKHYESSAAILYGKLGLEY